MDDWVRWPPGRVPHAAGYGGSRLLGEIADVLSAQNRLHGSIVAEHDILLFEEHARLPSTSPCGDCFGSDPFRLLLLLFSTFRDGSSGRHPHYGYFGYQDPTF